MENCIFCNIIDNKDNIRNLKINKILYEDDLLMVIPAKGAPVVGWIMLIVKKHINGFAELTPQELIHVEKIVGEIKKIYLEYFHINSILLEHGSTSEGRHPQSIVHAHMHLIPFNFNENIEKELMNELQVKFIDSILDIRINRKQDYWLYCNSKGKFFCSANIKNVTRSIFMKLVVKQIEGNFQYEWRNVETDDKFLNEIITLFENNINRLGDK